MPEKNDFKAEFIVKRIEDRLREEEKVEEYVDLLEKTIERIDKDLAQMFQKANKDGNWSKAKINKYNRKSKLKEKIKEEVTKYAKGFKSKLRDDLAQEYKQQSLFTQNQISAATDKTFNSLPKQAVKTVAIDEAEIAGKTLNEYISQYSTDLAHRIQTDVFQGISLGENPEKVAKRLSDAGKMGRARANTTYRSWYNKILNDASFDTYKQADIPKVEFSATLDQRTTATCFTKDGKIYDIDNAPRPPLHYNCRSTLIPVVNPENYEAAKSYEEYIKDGRRSKKQLREIKNKLDRGLEKGWIGEDEYNKFDQIIDEVFRNRRKNGIIKIDETLEVGGSAPKEYKPYGVVDLKGTQQPVKQRVFYDKNGLMSKQIDTNPHNRPDQHPFGSNGEHAHEFQWESGELKNRTMRDLNSLEREINKDILPNN